MRRTALCLAAALLCVQPWTSPVLSRQVVQPPVTRGTAPRIRPAFSRTDGPLFDNVVGLLQERYVDEEVRRLKLPPIIERFRPRAAQASSLQEQRQVVHELLGEIPASHLGLLSSVAFDAVIADLQGRAYPTLGFQLVGFAGGYYAGFVLEGGPAVRAGLLAGDRVRAIDGLPVERSPRVEWRSDDAHIGDDRDPAVHMVRVSAGDRISLEIERKPGELATLSIAAAEYSTMDAARASVRAIERGGRRVGYLHFWYIHITGVPEFLRDTLSGRLRDCDAIVVDLRGRGGAYTEIARILEVIRMDRERTQRPYVALVDRQSRSGKDILAYELKTQRVATLVGEPSAGAVIPATFADVGHDTILMFPTRPLPRYTELLEFKPVEPDVLVERAGAFAAAADPILDVGVAEAVRQLSPHVAAPWSVNLLEQPLPARAREEVSDDREQPPD